MDPAAQEDFDGLAGECKESRCGGVVDDLIVVVDFGKRIIWWTFLFADPLATRRDYAMRIRMTLLVP